MLFFQDLPGMGLPGMSESGDHGGRALHGYPLHIMFDSADTAHLFPAPGPSRASVDQQRKGASMPGALLRAFAVEDQDSAMMRRGTQYIPAGDSRIPGDDRAAQRALAFF